MIDKNTNILARDLAFFAILSAARLTTETALFKNPHVSVIPIHVSRAVIAIDFHKGGLVFRRMG